MDSDELDETPPSTINLSEITIGKTGYD